MDTSTPTGSDYEAVMESNGKTYFLFSNGYCLLSNSHLTPFTVDRIRYRSVEQFMWASRALHFHDYFAHQAIMEEWCARKYKDIRIDNYDCNQWRRVSNDLLEKALQAKFAQHGKAKEKLLSTGQAVIVYATKSDRVLGSGLDLDDGRNINENDWQGLNILGTLLMMMRDKLTTKNQ